MKKYQKYLALGCCAALTASSLCGCASTEANNEASEEITVIQEALEDLDGVSDLVKHSTTAGKEETVYAILTADGDLEETIVSEWLKNPKGDEALEDVSELSDIQVIKGSADYSPKGSDSQIVWSNDGSDIYYQGTSTKQLPVDVHISYELDGQSVSAEELSGASGHLKISFTYTNHVSKKAVIHGENRNIYQPFFMVSGMMLDNEKAQNVTVDHGSLVNSGEHTLVFGIAMPGLKESLGLDHVKDDEGKLLDLEIPETVTVEADVTDFSLMMTLTAASNTALSQLGLDDIDSIEELQADMDKLTSGMEELLDGASRLNDGASKLQGGVNELSSKTPELESGVGELYAGIKELSSGLSELTSHNESLTAGAQDLSNGLGQLYGALSDDEAKASLNELVSGSASFSDGLSNASSGLSQIADGYSAADNESISALMSQLTAYADQLIATGLDDNVTIGKAIKGLIGTYQGLYADVSKVSEGVSALSQNYTKLNQGIGSAVGNISSVSENVKKLADGASTLNSGIKDYTNGASSALAGAGKLKNGLGTLNEKVPALSSGVKQLTDGASELASGTGDLENGVIRFNEEGIQKLADVLGNDLETYYDRLKAVQDFAKEYTSYAGCKDDVTCSVKFIYKTGSIE